MAKQVLLQAEKRTDLKSTANKRLRKAGFVPAIIYGKNIDSVPITVKSDDVRRIVKNHGRNAIINIEVNEDKSYSAIIKNISYVNLKNDLMHIDFQHVSMDEELKATVAIRVVGRETLESNRLVLIRQLDEVKIKGLPQHVPDYLEIDVAELEAGSTITVGDIKYPEGISPDEDEENLVLSVNEAKQEVIEDDSDGSDDGEPELVSKDEDEQ